ncbi:p35 [Clostera anastomosis granulovirus A]|uniref:P35 n=1 Tax=Clostera anastomosis granulovirus A TaxID=1986289 RepID=U5KBL3_9BBAC|nr:p35 [Clostera anastomosis granulovirus Henan]AGQ20313.1 p35 [Clostera anastomosis granulovirus Henan]
MCVLFPTDTEASRTVIRDTVIDCYTREMVYSNSISRRSLTKPTLMMFNLSGPVCGVERKGDEVRYEVERLVDEEFDKLELSSSTVCDGPVVNIFKAQHYSVSCQRGRWLVDNYIQVLSDLGYTDAQSLLQFKTMCLPQLVTSNDDYVVLCVLKPGFEDHKDKNLSFRYVPEKNRVVIPLAHEMNDNGLYDYNVVVLVDGVTCNDGHMCDITELVTSLSTSRDISRSTYRLRDEVVNDRRCIYKALEFRHGKDEWRILSSGAIYSARDGVLMLRLKHVFTPINKNFAVESAKVINQ